MVAEFLFGRLFRFAAGFSPAAVAYWACANDRRKHGCAD
jgi:hypothetical protein